MAAQGSSWGPPLGQVQLPSIGQGQIRRVLAQGFDGLRGERPLPPRRGPPWKLAKNLHRTRARPEVQAGSRLQGGGVLSRSRAPASAVDGRTTVSIGTEARTGERIVPEQGGLSVRVSLPREEQEEPLWTSLADDPCQRVACLHDLPFARNEARQRACQGLKAQALDCFSVSSDGFAPPTPRAIASHPSGFGKTNSHSRRHPSCCHCCAAPSRGFLEESGTQTTILLQLQRPSRYARLQTQRTARSLDFCLHLRLPTLKMLIPPPRRNQRLLLGPAHDNIF